MKKQRSWALLVAPLAIGLAALTTSGPVMAANVAKQLTSESVISQIENHGVMRVGVSTFVPWVMRDKQGKLVGFEIDVARQLAKDMGVKVEFVPTQWDGIIPALLAGKFDVIISSMTVKPKRNLTINFTIPYSHSGLQIAASKKIASGYSVKDFNSPKVKIACRRGTTACSIGMELFPKAQFLRFDDDAQAFQEVINGNAHAVLSSAPKPAFWTLRQPEALYQPTTENLTQTNEAFGVRKGDPDAINFFDNWIHNHVTNGWLKKRHDYWFTTMDWQKNVNLKQ